MPPVVPLETLVEKFRAMFPQKSKKDLKDVFTLMGSAIYKEGDQAKQNAKPKSSLNLIEFKIAMYRIQSGGLSFEDIKRIFIWLDTNHSGRVDFDEFSTGVRVRFLRTSKYYFDQLLNDFPVHS
jgi:Ca2+-binding EF-hand superfamily protein